VAGCFSRGNKAKIGVIFSASPPDAPTWPHVGYDYERRAEELVSRLREAVPEAEFVYEVVYYASEWLRRFAVDKSKLHSLEDVKRILSEEMRSVVGFVVWYLGLWSAGIAQAIAETGKPVVLVDDVFCGSGEFILSYAWLRGRGYRVAGVASSNFSDVARKVRLLYVLHKLRNLRIVVVRRDFPGWFDSYEKALSEALGSKLIRVMVDELRGEYEEADMREAREVAERWVSGAKSVEADEEEVVKAARMYIALKKLMRRYGAEAITVDCFPPGHKGLPAYPCLGFFQLLNEGYIATCEADLDSCVTQAAVQFLTGRPGFVSDPVIDQGRGWIIYAHCLAAAKVYGRDGATMPYRIRTHSEERAGAAVQAYWPVGEPITTVKFNVAQRAMSIHSGRIVANVEDERACRTKVAAEANVDAILERWEPSFGWHRVSVVGDYRNDFIDLARLLGFRVIEEDKPT